MSVPPVFGRPPTPEEPEIEPDVPDEVAIVAGWRIEQLVKNGCDIVLAGQLAALPDFDLHGALTMLHNGCAPHLIYKILA